MMTGKKNTDILGIPEQKRLNDFWSQIKEEQKNIDMSLFEGVFGYNMLGKMLQTLHNLKSVHSYNQEYFQFKIWLWNLEIGLKRCQKVLRKMKKRKC